MVKRSPIPQSRRHIQLFDEDWDYLEQLYGAASPSKLGVGPAIRNIIHTYVNNLKARAQQLVDERSPR